MQCLKPVLRSKQKHAFEIRSLQFSRGDWTSLPDPPTEPSAYILYNHVLRWVMCSVKSWAVLVRNRVSILESSIFGYFGLKKGNGILNLIKNALDGTSAQDFRVVTPYPQNSSTWTVKFTHLWDWWKQTCIHWCDTTQRWWKLQNCSRAKLNVLKVWKLVWKVLQKFSEAPGTRQRFCYQGFGEGLDSSWFPANR